MTIRIALQLYTLRQQAAADFPATLREVAAAGYEHVEFAGCGDMAVADLRNLIDDLGLRAVSAHVPFVRFDEDVQSVVAELETLGCRYAVAPSIPQDHRGLDSIPALCERFNRWGAACREAGLRFGYHNHNWELEPRDGSTMLDRLAAGTDAALVHFQVDVYWALVSGADPAALIARLAGRAPTLHAKELASGAEPRDTTVGDGVTPWEDLLAAAATAGTEWCIVEQEDDPANAYRDIRRSLGNLRRLLGEDLAASASR